LSEKEIKFNMKAKNDMQIVFLRPALLAFLILIGMLCLVNPVQAADTGFKSGGSADGGGGWGSWTVARLATDNNARGDTVNNDVYASLWTFGFGIPGSSAIDGIEVELQGKNRIVAAVDYAIELSWDGGTNWTTAKTDSFTSTSEAIDTLGGSSDTWGRTWSDTEFSDANFKLRIKKTSGDKIQVDYIWVKVYYGLGSGNTAPDTPNINNFNTGAWTSNNQPDLQFDLTDPDAGDIVKYQIQIDDDSGFASPSIDYTESSGSAAPRNSVTYTPSSALSDGSYYWQVKDIDDDAAVSAWATANNPSIAFKVDATNPTAPGNLTENSKTTSSVTLNFGSQTTEANFATYKIFSKQGASGVTESDTQHTNPSLAYIDYNGGSSITISGLTPDTQYVFNIWTYDLAGNKASATEVSVTTEAGEPEPEPEPLPVTVAALIA
jgi:hypothetical protein